MREGLLVFGAVICFHRGLKRREAGHDIPGPIFAFELNIASAPGKEHATEFRERRTGELGVFAVSVRVRHFDMGYPESAHFLPRNNGFRSADRLFRLGRIRPPGLCHVRSASAALAAERLRRCSSDDGVHAPRALVQKLSCLDEGGRAGTRGEDAPRTPVAVKAVESAFRALRRRG